MKTKCQAVKETQATYGCTKAQAKQAISDMAERIEMACDCEEDLDYTMEDVLEMLADSIQGDSYTIQ